MESDQLSGKVKSSFLQSFHRAPDLAFQILNSIPTAICVTLDKTCQDIIHNKKAAEFLRLQLQESLPVLNNLPFKMYHKGRVISPDQIPIQRAAYRGEEVKDLEIDFFWDDGVHKTAVCSSSPLLGENGSILGAAAVFEDITAQKEAEDKLKKSEEKFREIVKYVPEGVYEIDFHGPRLKSVSDTMCLLSGYTREEMLSMNVFDILEENSRTVFQERIRKQLGGEKIDNNVEYDIKAKDGRMLHALLNITFTYKDGKPEGALVIAHEVTERKRAEQALRESEERYRALVHATNNIVWRHSADGKRKLDYLNTSTGEKRSEPEEHSGDWLKTIHPDDRAKTYESWMRAVKNKSLYEFEHRILQPDGNYHYFVSRAVPVFDKDGETLEWIGVGKDINERKLAEKALRESGQLLEKTVRERTMELHDLNNTLTETIESITDAFFTLDKEWRVIYWNNAAEKMFNMKREGILGKNFWEIFPKSVGSEFYNQYHLALSENKPVFFEARGVSTGLWVEARVYPSKLGLTVYIKDITDRKRMGETLRKKEEELRQITDNMADVIMKSDTQGLAQYISPSFTKLMGYPVEDKLGKSVFDTLHPNDAERIIFAFKYVMEAGIKEGRYEYRCKSADGRYLWLETTGKALFDDKGICVGAVFGIRDITNRKLMEDKLRQSEERFYKAFNLSPAMTIIRGLDGKCIDINETCLTTLGYTREEVIGSFLDEFNFYGDAGLPAELKQAISEKKQIRNLEVELYTKQGEKRTGLLSGEFIELYGEPCVIYSVNDITELRMLEKEIAHLDRLNLVGEMAGGIAHEIRNPMMVVRGYLEYIGKKKEFGKYADRFQLMIGELDRANSIITEYLTLARNKAYDAKTENINDILNDLISLIETDSIKDDKYVNFELEEVPDLLLERNDIKQLVLNLVRNGLEAMYPGGYLTLKTFTDGHEVVLAVNDQGKGIPPENMNKMGIPFFTTKDYGTGLGLAVCYKIASRHNASISIETCAAGTTFFIKFKVPGKYEI